MTPIRISLASLALLLLCSIPTVGAQRSLDAVVPADTTVLIKISSAPDLLERWSATPFAKLWTDPQIKSFFAPLREELEIDRWKETVKEETGRELEELIAMFSGDLIFYMPSLHEEIRKLEESDDDDAMPAMVILADVADNEEALEKLILDQQEQEDDEASEEHRVTRITRDYRDIVMHIDQSMDGEEPEEEETWVIVDGILVMAPHPADVEKVITNVLDGGAAEPLSASASYQSIGGRVSASDILVFVNLEHLIPLLRETVEEEEKKKSADSDEPDPVSPSAVLDALAVDELRAFYSSLQADSTSMQLDVGITYSSPKGILRVLAYGPGTAPRPDFIPVNATNFGAARFDVKTAWEGIEEIANAMSPGFLEMMSGQIATMAQSAAVELDLKGNLLGNLGNELVAIQSAPERSSSAVEESSTSSETTPATPNQVIVLSINERQGIELTIETLKGMAGQGSELFDTREYLGTQINTLKWSQQQGQQISYALTDSYFLLSIGDTTALESVLVAMQRSDVSVWERDDVKAALAQLPDGASALQFQDLGATGHTVLQALAMLASVDEDMGLCDPGAVPDQGLLRKYLGAAVSGIYKDDRALAMRMKILTSDFKEGE
jgi:hypothetical protein